jgi:hypothetical protein
VRTRTQQHRTCLLPHAAGDCADQPPHFGAARVVDA